MTEAILRTGGDPAAMVSRVRAAVNEVDPDLPIGEIRPLADIVDLNLAHEKTMAVLSACFGLVALALTCIGGQTAHAGDRHSPGIGSGAGQVALLMMQDMARPGIRSQLFGIAPHDYSMPAGSAVLLEAISAVA